MDLYGMEDGSVLQTHDAETCVGGWCCIHNPSDHPLNTAPLSWDSSRRVMMRICPCGIYHPDPDHLSFVVMHSPIIAILQGIHDCCKKGCCDGART
jgi:hypothetical protein